MVECKEREIARKGFGMCANTHNKDNIGFLKADAVST